MAEMTIRERVAAYLKERPLHGATVKEIAIDLELNPTSVYKALHSNPFIWVERWVHTPGGGRPLAIYRIVPEDAPSPAMRRRSAA
jgi:predicted ArsR family transcriptional regulator